MARGQRVGKRTRGLFGILAVFIAGMTSVAVGQRIGGTNPFDVLGYVRWSLVVLAVLLDFLAVNLLVHGFQKIEPWKVHKWFSHDWEDWSEFAILSAVAIIMFFATLWAWAQHVLENLLVLLSNIPYAGWINPGDISDQRSKVCGLVAFVIVIGLTNWIWHHPMFKGPIREGVRQAKGQIGEKRRRNSQMGGQDTSFIPGMREG